MKYSGRDILDEVRAAVIAAGKTVGKGSNDVRICAWVEGPFTVYVGHVSLGGSLNPISSWGPFAQSIQSTVLRDPTSFSSTPPALESRYNDGTVYLNPFSTVVKDNLRKTILEAAYKGWVAAIIIDDHFGVDTRVTPDVLPKVKTAILKANSAQSQPDPNQWIRDQLTKQLNDIKYELSAQNVELWASTNAPKYARDTQLQDVSSWVSTGKINRLNVQLYRGSSFDSDWSSLQTELSAISQLKSKQVYFAVSLIGSNPEAEMARQVSKVTNLTDNLVPGYAVGFEDQSWMAKQKTYGG
jgi:uncharacterized lipoprotein YddW (UPF0748 family)